MKSEHTQAYLDQMVAMDPRGLLEGLLPLMDKLETANNLAVRIRKHVANATITETDPAVASLYEEAKQKAGRIELIYHDMRRLIDDLTVAHLGLESHHRWIAEVAHEAGYKVDAKLLPAKKPHA
jgi:hypothetical protein